MKRARLIIKEVQVARQGEIKNFQIKLPKDVKRIIAIETDVRLDSERAASETDGVKPSIETKPDLEYKPTEGSPTAEGRISPPYLSWTLEKNPVMGKLKLKSMERTNIFYEEWLHFILFNGGIPDMSMGMFPRSPISLNKNRKAKKVDVPVETTIVNGIYHDTIGTFLKKDITYTVKVFVWVETEEESDGVVFDFQEQASDEPESKTEKINVK